MEVGGIGKRREAVALPTIEKDAGADRGDGVVKFQVVERGEHVPAGEPDSKIGVHENAPQRDRAAAPAPVKHRIEKPFSQGKNAGDFSVNATAMPDGLLTMIKTATRALVAAAAVPGSTGPERVEQLTGYSRGQISKWCSDGCPAIMPPEVMCHLEFVTQRPIFATTLAALTGHRLAPLADADPVGPQSLIADIVELTGSHSRFLSSLAEGLKDMEMTPGEAKASLGVGVEHQTHLNTMFRRLAEIAEGAAGRAEAGS